MPLGNHNERAKNFNGMLQILKETHKSLAMATQLLGRSMDTESVMERRRCQAQRDTIEQLGRDLATGLVDLEDAPALDRFNWSTIFELDTPDLDVVDDSIHPMDRPTAMMRVPKRKLA